METLVRYRDIEISMDKTAEYILDVLADKGIEAYVVGGCVRDSILNDKYKLGVEINDWDICTEARPEVVTNIFKNKGMRVIETGLKHNTVTVLNKDGVGYEITTFRTDGASAYNKRTIGIGMASELMEDLSKRDFTMNAMAYNKKQGIIAVSGALQDIEDNVIRCVGDPYRRFQEDALRIVRAVRFAAKLGYSIDERTKQAMSKLKNSLSDVSGDRKASELCKLLLGQYKLTALQEYMDIVFEIIPELKPLNGLDQQTRNHCYDAYKHTVVATSSLTGCEDIKVLLALLLHDTAKPETRVMGDDGNAHFYGHAGFGSFKAREILNRMHFSKEIINDVCNLITYHDNDFTNKMEIKVTLGKIGHSQFKRLLLVKRADILGKSEYAINKYISDVNTAEQLYREIILEDAAFRVADLDINGRDLIMLGYAPGSRLGDVLSELLRLVMNESVLNTREELVKYAKQQLDEPVE